MNSCKRLTDDQRQQIERNNLRGMGDKVNARKVGCSERSVQRVLGTYGLGEPSDEYMVTLTSENKAEEFKVGDTFSMLELRAHLDFGNFPDGLTMEFGDDHTGKMHGSQLVRDDGRVMKLSGIGRHDWR